MNKIPTPPPARKIGKSSKDKGLNKHPFWAELVVLPLTYTVAILKLLVMIPTWIIAKCNDILNSIENQER